MISQLSAVPSALARARNNDIIDIREEGSVTMVARRRGDEGVTAFVKQAWRRLFGCCREEAKPKEDSTTVVYFRKLFGSARLVRLAGREHIDLSKNVLTKKDMERLMVGACEVYEEDLNELLREVGSSRTRTIRHLTEKQTGELRAACKGVQTIDHVSRKVLDQLFLGLVPFKTLEEIFLGNVPSVNDGSPDSGKDFVGRRQRVLFYEMMRRSPPDEATWAMYMGKKLVDREIPKGVVFRNGHGGYGKVHAVVHGGGAYKLFIKQVDNESKCHENVVVYRGMRLLRSATDWWRAGLDGFRREIGAQGPIATAEETKALLSDLRKGFITDVRERVCGVGMSLGGTHVMRDAALFADRFRKIVVLAAPGIDMPTAKLFASKADGHEIEHWWEKDDFCDQLEDAHVGMGCDPERAHVTVTVLIPGEKEVSLDQLIKERPHFPGELKHVVALREGAAIANNILGRSHCRLTLLEPHRRMEFSTKKNLELVQRILAHDDRLLCDKKWEQARQLITHGSPGIFSEFANRWRSI